MGSPPYNPYILPLPEHCTVLLQLFGISSQSLEKAHELARVVGLYHKGIARDRVVLARDPARGRRCGSRFLPPGEYPSGPSKERT